MQSALLHILVGLVGLVYCFPDGAPIDACVKSRANEPNHGAARTQPIETLPYKLIATGDHYGPGAVITVTIDGGKVPFKGFFIQGRSLETNDWIGSWEKLPNTTVHAECSAITHADPREKTKATLVWKAPDNKPAGRVYFTGTVLQSYRIFWSNLIALVPQPIAQSQPNLIRQFF